MKTRPFAKTGSGHTHTKETKLTHIRQNVASLPGWSLSASAFAPRALTLAPLRGPAPPLLHCLLRNMHERRNIRGTSEVGPSWLVYPSIHLGISSLSVSLSLCVSLCACMCLKVCVRVCQMGTLLRVSGEKGQFAHLRASRGQKSTRALSGALDAPSPCKATQT